MASSPLTAPASNDTTPSTPPPLATSTTPPPAPSPPTTIDSNNSSSPTPPSQSPPAPVQPPPPPATVQPPPPPATVQSPPPSPSLSPPTSDSSPPPPSNDPLPPPPSPSSNDDSPELPSKSNPPPPPRNHTFSPPKSGGKNIPKLAPPAADNFDDSPSSNQDDTSTTQAIMLGVAAAVMLFLVILLISTMCFCLRKKKKKPQQPGYNPEAAAAAAKGYYNNNGAAIGAAWKGGDHNIKIPLPPGMAAPSAGGWQQQQQGLSVPMSGGDTNSSNYSGPHGPILPPPSPNLALGFNKSTFTYEELASATSGFAENNMLGQGGFGYVYKGVLPNGKEVAVKQLKSGSGQGEREFQAEVEIISRVHHRHLVSLVGYCITGTQRLLVYEFVPNKTLEYHLHGKGVPTMSWSTRLRIAIGSAKGLAYLHEDCHPRIIHRDIKTANILVDYKFEAMVADFGLAKSNSDTNTHVSTRVMGTFGYLAPEYAASGKLTEKSDVFSYGVVLLELITGRRPIDRTNRMEDSLVDWARPVMAQALAEENFEEVADPKLDGNYNPQEMARMIACAAAAVRHSGKRRPKMSQIVRSLEGDSISFDDLSGGVRPGDSSQFSSGSSEYDSGTYSSKMRQFRKAAMTTSEYTGDYSVATSEYGLNPSDSSSSSGEMKAPTARKSRQQL